MRLLQVLLYSALASASAIPNSLFASRDLSTASEPGANTTANITALGAGSSRSPFTQDGILRLVLKTYEWCDQNRLPHLSILALSTSSDPKRNLPNWLLARIPGTNRIFLTIGSPGVSQFQTQEYSGRGLKDHRIFIWPLPTGPYGGIGFTEAGEIAVAHADAYGMTETLNTVVLSQFRMLGAQDSDPYYLFRHTEDGGAYPKSGRSDAVFVNSHTKKSFVLKNLDLQVEEVQVREDISSSGRLPPSGSSSQFLPPSGQPSGPFNPPAASSSSGAAGTAGTLTPASSSGQFFTPTGSGELEGSVEEVGAGNETAPDVVYVSAAGNDTAAASAVVAS